MKNVENVILKNIEQNGKLSTSDIEKIKQILTILFLKNIIV